MLSPILRPSFTTARADQLGHLELHHLRTHSLDRPADHIGVLIALRDVTSGGCVSDPPVKRLVFAYRTTTAV
jgi:hypothetical protein